MKYLVMECHPGYAVVLRDDGRFLKAANMHYEVGQTVTNVVEMHLPHEQEQPMKKNNRRWISAFAATAACLVLVVTSIFFAGQIPYASVYMTINPEVRIDVNRHDVVVDVEGMNLDGTNLLEGYDHRKKDLDTVMDELVDLAIDMGYLYEGGKITLSLDADENWITSHEAALSDHLNAYLTDKITITIDVAPVPAVQPEQPDSQPTQETSPGQSVVIPAGTESDYGASDYGTDPTDGNFENTDDGQTDYADASGNDGQTDYEVVLGDDSQTDYEIVPGDDSQTDYEIVPGDDGQTDYGIVPDDNSLADNDGFDAPGDGQSGYNISVSDDPDDGQSDFDQSDDGVSAYEESGDN